MNGENMLSSVKNHWEFLNPYIHKQAGIKNVSIDILIAFSPLIIYSVYLLGKAAVFLLLSAVVTAIISEIVFNITLKKSINLDAEGSVLTGIILLVMLPVSIPWWVLSSGVLFSIIIKKILNGPGRISVNSAVAGWLFIQLVFPQTAGSRLKYLFQTLFNGGASLINIFGNILSANIIANMQLSSFIELSLLAVVLGVLYLLFSGRLELHSSIPYFLFLLIGFTLAAIYSGKINYPALFGPAALLSIFILAGETATLPLSSIGKVVFGTGCGIISLLFYALSREGCAFYLSVFLMNLAVPLIDLVTIPRPLGVKY